MHADRNNAPTLECPACGAANPAAARFCCRCGAPQHGVSLRSATRLTPLLQQWRSLKPTLTRKDVRRLLGEPLRVQPPDPADAQSVERWKYVYEAAETAASASGLVAGEVVFAADSRVLTWTEPDWPLLPDRPA